MPLLEVKNLGISFGGLQAVDDFEITMEPGELYGLIGPNGAGKTTIFNLLTGVYAPNSGSYLLDGESMRGKGPEEISRSGVGRTFQNIRLFTRLSVLDNVKAALYNQYTYGLGASFFRTKGFREKEQEIEDRAQEILEVFELQMHGQEKAANLPYGKQRKLEIARALATNPKLLLLDEPAAGMNPAESAEIMKTIKFIQHKYGCAILLIEHDMKVVMGICEQITVISFGKILACAGAEEVKNHPTVISAYLGEDRKSC